jgi:hypothetical protein
MLPLSWAARLLCVVLHQGRHLKVTNVRWTILCSLRQSISSMVLRVNHESETILMNEGTHLLYQKLKANMAKREKKV